MKNAFSAMQPYLSDHWFARLKDSVEALEASVAAGLVRNVQFVKWKYDINEAVAQTCNSANKSKSDWADRMLVLGAYNLPAALRQATRDGVDDRAALLAAMLPCTNSFNRRSRLSSNEASP